MRSTWVIFFCTAFFVACSVDHSGLGASDVGFDGGPGFDAGAQPDVLGPRDAGSDTVELVDATTPDVLAPVDAPVAMDTNVPVDAGCVLGARECVDDLLRECNPGGWDERTCEYECRDDGDSTSCFDLVPSNLNRPMSQAPGTGNVNVNDAVWDTDDCAGIDDFWYVQTVAGEIELCVVSYENVTFQSLRVVGGRGLVIVAKGTVTIEGEISADGEGTVPGPGAASGQPGVVAGVATYSGGNGQTEEVMGSTFNSDGGGGGGGAADEGGEGGSVGGEGPSVRAAGGSRGASFGGGGYRLIPLRAGGAGGVGGTGESRGFGGGGGGAIQFSARGDIRVGARINISGGGGRGGMASDTNSGAGGGGGAGGTVHFETAGTVVFEGGNEVLAAGGGGGGGAACGVDGGGGGEEENAGIGGGSRGGQCTFTHFSTTGGAGDEDGRGDDAPDLARATANGGGGGGAGGLIVIRASERMGTLGGSGRRENAEPTIAAIE